MNDMRKLMEAVEQLNEYLVRKGDPIKNLLYLNVFGDTGHIENDGIAYGPNDVAWEEGEIDPELQQEWLRQVKPYAKQAGQLKKTILKISSKGRKLTDAEAYAAEDTWYDGSDLYDDLELAFDELPAIWENQIGIIHEILAGEVQDPEGDYAAFDETTQVSEGASSRQWEIAINNLIGEGDERYGVRGRHGGPKQSATWEWVRTELHGMLDFQPDDDDGGLGHENTLGHEHSPNFGGWPDKQR